MSVAEDLLRNPWAKEDQEAHWICHARYVPFASSHNRHNSSIFSLCNTPFPKIRSINRQSMQINRALLTSAKSEAFSPAGFGCL